MINYFKGIWAARYFWSHLAMADLRSRWRRSFFGPLWSILQPLGLTILVSIVFSRLMNTEIGSYAPYILSGLICWDYVVSTVVGGSLAFVQADPYIKQNKHPLAIYTLRNATSGLIVLATASSALIVWVLVTMPENFGWHWLSAPTVFPILLAIAWPMATITAYIATRFRDLPHALGLVFQAMWFVSPIYFHEQIFRDGDLSALVDYNPIYHLLEIVRAPLLRGDWPTGMNYLWCAATILALATVAGLLGLRAERRVILYL